MDITDAIPTNETVGRTSQSLIQIIFSGSGEETYYEEIANSLTHLFGVVLAVVAIYLLFLIAIEFRRSRLHVIGCITYGLCLFILYALSTLYHSVGVFYHHEQAFREAFQKLDHVAIYFMIAGCYTPMCLINLVGSKKHPKLGYFVLSTIWLCAILGSWAKLFFGPKQIPPLISNGFYLFMGWFAILIFKPMKNTSPSVSLRWQFYSGISYSTGVAFLIWDSLHFNHAIWHLHVIMGSFCGFIAIMTSAIIHGSEKVKSKSDVCGAFELISFFLSVEYSGHSIVNQTPEDLKTSVVSAPVSSVVKRSIRPKSMNVII